MTVSFPSHSVCVERLCCKSPCVGFISSLSEQLRTLAETLHPNSNMLHLCTTGAVWGHYAPPLCCTQYVSMLWTEQLFNRGLKPESFHYIMAVIFNLSLVPVCTRWVVIWNVHDALNVKTCTINQVLLYSSSKIQGYQQVSKQGAMDHSQQ